jgi:hypothetical protein
MGYACLAAVRSHRRQVSLRAVAKRYR